MTWNSEGRRCITGTQVGEFTQWDGRTFSFEHIIQVRISYAFATDVQLG